MVAAGHPAVGHAVVAQGVYVWQTQLQGVVTKHITDHAVKLRLLPIQQILTGWALPPSVQSRGFYNLKLHATDTTARFQRQLPVAVA